VRIPDGYGPPTVIGGSGTRVAAQLMVELGFYMGSDLNDALDNLTYTLLFKRPRWFLRRASRQRRVSAAARPLVRAMTDGSSPGPREVVTVLGALLGTMPRGGDRLAHWRGLRGAPGSARRVFESRGHDPAAVCGWGWKEPNSIVLLDELDTAFPGMRFIHVLRDPEQVARGKNRKQVYNWSQHIGLEPPRPGDHLVARSLEYRAITERTAHTGRTRLGPRYHQLDINRLCAELDPELDALLAFLDLEVDEDTRARLRAIPNARRLLRLR
jgi:hypothetical protein